MSKQLLPCPFCGGPAKAAEAYIRGDQAFAHIHCENHCEVAPSAGASSALFYWSDLRKENVRIHSDDKAKLEATERAHAKWNRRATQPAAGEPAPYEKPYDYYEGLGRVDFKCPIDLRRVRDHLESLLDAVPEGPLYAAPPAAAGELVEAKEIGEMTITLRDGVKCFSFEEYSEAYKLPEGLHYLYTAPPAAAHGEEAKPMKLIGESHEEQGVVWTGKNPHAWPAGTKFYAMRAQGDGGSALPAGYGLVSQDADKPWGDA